MRDQGYPSSAFAGRTSRLAYFLPVPLTFVPAFLLSAHSHPGVPLFLGLFSLSFLKWLLLKLFVKRLFQRRQSVGPVLGRAWTLSLLVPPTSKQPFPGQSRAGCPGVLQMFPQPWARHSAHREGPGKCIAWPCWLPCLGVTCRIPLMCPTCASIPAVCCSWKAGSGS